MMSSEQINQEIQRLLNIRVADTTLIVYKRAYDEYLKYCTKRRLPISTAAEIDWALAHFLAYLSLTGQPKSRAHMAFWGLLFVRPDLARVLHFANAVRKGLIRSHPVISRPPLTWPITVLIAVTMAKNGFVNEALATLVAFDGLLRISEFINLKIGDVALPSDSRLGSRIHKSRTVLHIRKSKTGDHQSSELYDRGVTSLLRRHIRPYRDRLHRSLFRIRSVRDYRAVFKNAIASLHLQHCKFVPHSLRHGGATHAIRTGNSMATIQQRGRWKSASSATIYLQQAAAVRLDIRIPQRQHDYASELVGNLSEVMSRLMPSAQRRAR